VAGAQLCGMRLTDRTRTTAVVSFAEMDLTYDILHVIPFTSSRGKMSVVVRQEGGTPIMLTKGADERVVPLCGRTVERVLSSRIDAFAREGLRTLVYAFRELTDESWNMWQKEIEKASIGTAEERERKLSAVFTELEMDLTYAGVTAVEDRLQEGVRECIENIRGAGIRVWMLTGDKEQTARQIATSSGLIADGDQVISFVEDKRQGEADEAFNTRLLKVIEQRLTDVAGDPSMKRAPSANLMDDSNNKISEEFFDAEGVSQRFVDQLSRTNPASMLATGTFGGAAGEASSNAFSNHSLHSDEVKPLISTTRGLRQSSRINTTLLVAGKTLELLQRREHASLLERFKPIILSASTVISCRTTPDQKALIVRIAKEAGKMTLAIGDGGNDVAMIQEAHVGVGIVGNEGRQAALAADFAFGRFKFLQTLMLVHGHTAFQRTSYIVQYSFYKSMIIAWAQLLYNCFTNFSGVSFWNSFALTTYNGVYTVPLTFFYVMDIHLAPTTLLRFPQLYVLSQKARYMNRVTFFAFVARGVLQGTLGFFCGIALFRGDRLLAGGTVMDTQSTFFPVYAATVLLQVITVLMESHSVTWLHWGSFLATIVTLFGTFFVYSSLSDLDFYYTCQVLFKNSSFFLGVVALISSMFIPHAAFAAMKFWFFPNLLQVQRGIIHRLRTFAYTHPLRQRFVSDESQFLKSFKPTL
jgi:phospholipid-translocating ATPase